jgi:AraC family transcriptional activator of pobA
MAGKSLPVYEIENFERANAEKGFYSNLFPVHLKKHHFITTPHKHDFYITVLFTKGHGKHEIDFNTYDIKPGAVFMLSPGQAHNWTLSKNIDGYIFFHSAEFFDMEFTEVKVENYPFFNSYQAVPMVYLSKKALAKVRLLFAEIQTEYVDERLMKFRKIRSLINEVYIELSRVYIPKHETKTKNKNYLLKLQKFEQLLDKNYKTIKSPAWYASQMAITEKHLNRICKECLNKTTTEVISNRIVVEAKRLLILSNFSITQIADELGYNDNSYFTRSFKKNAGITPALFIKQNRS